MISGLRQEETFEDRYSRLGRWLRRFGRPIFWTLRGWLGLPRTLLVELRWRLGDELMALPVLTALRARHPRDQIVLWSQYPELFELAAVADALNVEVARVDRYLLLRGASRLVPRQIHYAARAGVRPSNDTPQLAPGRPSSRIQTALPGNSAPFIALAPGASWQNKRWLSERWQDLAERLVADGWPVVALGSADDPLISGVPSLIGATSVREAAQVLAQARLLVSCDSGLMHLALAVGTPVVALFGPTDPDFLTESPLLHPLRSKLACSGFWNHAPKAPAPGACLCGQTTCLHAIPSETVHAAVLSLLEATNSPETI